MERRAATWSSRVANSAKEPLRTLSVQDEALRARRSGARHERPVYDAAAWVTYCSLTGSGLHAAGLCPRKTNRHLTPAHQ